MNFFDPARPRDGLFPCWLGTRERLPNLELRAWVPDGEVIVQWYITLCVLEGNNASWPQYHLTNPQIIYGLMELYLSDPETFLRVYFSREPPQPRLLVRSASVLPTLEELGI